MRTLNKKINVGAGDTIKIRYINDVHIGHRDVDYKKFENDIKTIKEGGDHYYWIGGGDFCEFFNRRDKRHSADNEADFCHGQTDIVRTQIDYFCDHINPIMPKCLGIVEGNHENSMMVTYERDVTYEMLRLVDPGAHLFLGVAGFIQLSASTNGHRRCTVSIFCHHGYGGGVLKGGHALALERVFMWYDCDVALMGHRHIRMDIENIFQAPSGGGSVSRMRLAAFCGAYKAQNEDNIPDRSWETKRGFPPNVPKGYILEINPYFKELKLVKD